MSHIPESGYYYPNKLALATFNALTDVMGKNGLNAILNLAHQRKYIIQLPPDNLEKEFDFANFSAIQIAMEEMYGAEGGRLFIKRAGRATFEVSLKNHGAMAGVNSEAFRSLPLVVQLKIGVYALAKIITQLSDQVTTAVEDEANLKYIVHKCPHCWGRSGMDKAICSFTTGLLEGALKWISGGLAFNVLEAQCIAMGDDACLYMIDKKPIQSAAVGT